MLLGSDLRGSSSTECTIPNRTIIDPKWTQADNAQYYGDYAETKISYPNEQYTEDYKNRKMPVEAYNEFQSCPGGVVLAALAHYFMVAVLAWTACEVRQRLILESNFVQGIHVYFNVVNVLSRPRHRYLTKLSIFGKSLQAQISQRQRTLFISLNVFPRCITDELELHKLNFT